MANSQSGFSKSKSDLPALRPFVDDRLIRLPMMMFCALPYLRRATVASGSGPGASLIKTLTTEIKTLTTEDTREGQEQKKGIRELKPGIGGHFGATPPFNSYMFSSFLGFLRVPLKGVLKRILRGERFDEGSPTAGGTPGQRGARASRATKKAAGPNRAPPP
jgi:hypothetical protein